MRVEYRRLFFIRNMLHKKTNTNFHMHEDAFLLTGENLTNSMHVHVFIFFLNQGRY